MPRDCRRQSASAPAPRVVRRGATAEPHAAGLLSYVITPMDTSPHLDEVRSGGFPAGTHH